MLVKLLLIRRLPKPRRQQPLSRRNRERLNRLLQTNLSYSKMQLLLLKLRS